MRDTRNNEGWCGMKISWRDRDALISIGGIWDSFEIVGGGGVRDF